MAGGVLVLGIMGGLAWVVLAHPWLTVQTTPSMLSIIPVGALVVSLPVTWARIHPGQIILFHPVGEPNETVAHYVLTKSGNVLRTHSALSRAADAWVVRPSGVLGKVAVVVPGVGSVLDHPAILLVIVAGAGCAVLVTGRLARLVSLWGACTLALVLWLSYRPLVGAYQIAAMAARHHATVIAVSTGLLPERVRAVVGSRVAVVRAVDGALLHLVVPVSDGVSHRVVGHLVASASLPIWGWAIVWGVNAVIVGSAVLLALAFLHRGRRSRCVIQATKRGHPDSEIGPRRPRNAGLLRRDVQAHPDPAMQVP